MGETIAAWDTSICRKRGCSSWEEIFCCSGLRIFSVRTSTWPNPAACRTSRGHECASLEDFSAQKHSELARRRRKKVKAYALLRRRKRPFSDLPGGSLTTNLPGSSGRAASDCFYETEKT
jgi:hypothetical protein